jgi:transposase
MAKGKKKKSKKKDAALIEQNTQSLRRILKLYDQYSAEQNSVACTEVTKAIRSLMEEGDSLTKVRYWILSKKCK